MHTTHRLPHQHRKKSHTIFTFFPFTLWFPRAHLSQVCFHIFNHIVKTTILNARWQVLLVLCELFITLFSIWLRLQKSTYHTAEAEERDKHVHFLVWTQCLRLRSLHVCTFKPATSRLQKAQSVLDYTGHHYATVPWTVPGPNTQAETGGNITTSCSLLYISTE